MENNQLLLSIAIPTNGVVEWVIPVIDSIYMQRVDNSLFEVVITDNGEMNDLERALLGYSYPNLHYYKTNAKGFTNQIDAFEKCNGVFCKMLNHRSVMMSGSIEKILDIVRKYQDMKPILYFAEGHANGDEFIECANIDVFVNKMSYWVSWSAGTGVWKSDLCHLQRNKIDTMFPHTIYLFGLRDESKYVIWNGKYEKMADDAGKGGYDLFHTFGVDFLDLITVLRIRKKISTGTFIKIKDDLYNFLNSLYIKEVLLPTRHTFIISNVRQSMNIYYGNFYYKKMIVLSRLRVCSIWIRKMLKWK